MIYKGFSTFNRRKRFAVNDFELVKQDIFNHFNIKRGEKLMRPEFGTEVWDLLFEPFTIDTTESIRDEIKAICAYDPRVRVENVSIDQYEHGINVRIDLLYKTTNQATSLYLQFERDNQRVLVL